MFLFRIIFLIVGNIIKAPLTIMNGIKGLITRKRMSDKEGTVSVQEVELAKLIKEKEELNDRIKQSKDLKELDDLIEEAKKLDKLIQEKKESIQLAKIAEQEEELEESTEQGGEPANPSTDSITSIPAGINNQGRKSNILGALPAPGSSTTPLSDKTTQTNTPPQSQPTTNQTKVDESSILEYLNSPYGFAAGIFLIFTLILAYVLYKGRYFKSVSSRRRGEPTVRYSA